MKFPEGTFYYGQLFLYVYPERLMPRVERRLVYTAKLAFPQLFQMYCLPCTLGTRTTA